MTLGTENVSAWTLLKLRSREFVVRVVFFRRKEGRSDDDRETGQAGNGAAHSVSQRYGTRITELKRKRWDAGNKARLRFFLFLD